MEKTKYLIVGAGGHARVILSSIDYSKINVVGIFDLDKSKSISKKLLKKYDLIINPKNYNWENDILKYCAIAKIINGIKRQNSIL